MDVTLRVSFRKYSQRLKCLSGAASKTGEETSPLRKGRAMKKYNKLQMSFMYLLILLSCVGTEAIAQTPQQIAKNAFRATVILVMEDAEGQPLSFGSGFFVGDGQIATNLHVVEGAANGYAKLVGKEMKLNIEGWTALDKERDLIILKVPTFGPEIISLGNSDLVEVGETVYAVGNPRGLEGTFSDGIISSIRLLDGDKLIQITAPISPGSSGGPVLNQKGEAIGVSVLSIRDGQNLNFAIPSNYLKKLRTKIGSAKPLFQAPALTEVPTTKVPIFDLPSKITTQPDGRKMALIPAGEFEMGSNDGEADERPVHTVYVDAFYMDVYEVTNLDFQRFLLANPQWQKDRLTLDYRNYLKHWDGNHYPKGKANHPVVWVNWYAAMAYAEWAGKRLPTEAEWEKAARGRLAGKVYPWGNVITPVRANYGSNVGDTTSVGSYAPNGYGLYDMAGNVWEWCLDEYDADFYLVSPPRNPLSGDPNVRWLLLNYILVKSDRSRVLRGGSWYNTAHLVRVAFRLRPTPSYTGNYIGFRCVRAVSP